ncbi:TPA: hypothetical protein ACMDSD_003335 [Vibrio cholerae]|uniref:hypothetical protein n=1 Tax=Vibrio cholerae TaxID=666 RepID=UPI0028DAA450|nr:hypothetical protein [Vibrio cholerae]ELJ8688079.1 hypothetical protein [Vibrio cholerae]HDZ9324855.1 hypothetical protein [Vibrio cholerae]
MKVIFPKKASISLVKRTHKVLKMLEIGATSFRKTNKYEYKTLAIGNSERLVAVDNVIHVFNRHSDYERFIDNSAHR